MQSLGRATLEFDVCEASIEVAASQPRRNPVALRSKRSLRKLCSTPAARRTCPSRLSPIPAEGELDERHALCDIGIVGSTERCDVSEVEAEGFRCQAEAVPADHAGRDAGARVELQQKFQLLADSQHQR